MYPDYDPLRILEQTLEGHSVWASDQGICLEPLPVNETVWNMLNRRMFLPMRWTQLTTRRFGDCFQFNTSLGPVTLIPPTEGP